MAKGVSTDVLFLGSGTLSQDGDTLLFNGNPIAGGGGTKTYNVFTPDNYQPPLINFATLNTRNNWSVLNFVTGQSGMFVGVMPEAADLTNGLKGRITWTADGATAGNCEWNMAIQRGNTNIDTDSFDTFAAVATTTNGTAGVPNLTEITLTTIDGVVAGEMYRVNLYRSWTGGDTMTGRAEMITFEIRSAT